MLPEADKLVNLDGDILDLVEKLDGDVGLKTLCVLGNQRNVLNRVGFVNTMQFLGGFPRAPLGATVMEVKEPTIGLNETTLIGGVTDTASVDGDFVLFVVQHRGGSINTESLLSIPALLITARRRHVPRITLSIFLVVVFTRSVGLAGIESGQELRNIIIRVGALTR